MASASAAAKVIPFRCCPAEVNPARLGLRHRNCAGHQMPACLTCFPWLAQVRLRTTVTLSATTGRSSWLRNLHSSRHQINGQRASWLSHPHLGTLSVSTLQMHQCVRTQHGLDMMMCMKVLCDGKCAPLECSFIWRNQLQNAMPKAGLPAQHQKAPCQFTSRAGARHRLLVFCV